MLTLYDPFVERSIPDILDEAASTQCRFLGSVLGCYFVTIHAEPALPPVARAQLFFLTHMHR
jgi:hypothetical protein